MRVCVGGGGGGGGVGGRGQAVQRNPSCNITMTLKHGQRHTERERLREKEREGGPWSKVTGVVLGSSSFKEKAEGGRGQVVPWRKRKPRQVLIPP